MLSRKHVDLSKQELFLVFNEKEFVIPLDSFKDYTKVLVHILDVVERISQVHGRHKVTEHVVLSKQRS
jgi:hypothetical protein